MSDVPLPLPLESERLIVSIPINVGQVSEKVDVWISDCPMCVDRILGWSPDDVTKRATEHIMAAHEEELDQL